MLGAAAGTTKFADASAVTLEVSALQYFPWIRPMVERAILDQSLVPGRFIAVRNMKESEADGDLPAIVAALDIIGASFVETLDTKGTDGSNPHLGGPETITGYFGGIGQPNEHALMWLDEFLYYYTNYGIKSALNFNAGTILLGFLLYRLGVDIEFKISVFFGSRQPLSCPLDHDGSQAVQPGRRQLPADRLQLVQLDQQRDHGTDRTSSARRSVSKTWSASSTTSPRPGSPS